MTRYYPNVRFVLAMDRCTDDTTAMARRVIAGDPRFVIHEITECDAGLDGQVPRRVVGRSRRSRRETGLSGLRRRGHNLHPALRRAAVALIESRGVDMLSLISTLVAPGHGSNSSFNPRPPSNSCDSTPLSHNRNQSHRAFADGQFLMFSKAAYEKVGGHEAVGHGASRRS